MEQVLTNLRITQKQIPSSFVSPKLSKLVSLTRKLVHSKTPAHCYQAVKRLLNYRHNPDSKIRSENFRAAFEGVVSLIDLPVKDVNPIIDIFAARIDKKPSRANYSDNVDLLAKMAVIVKLGYGKVLAEGLKACETPAKLALFEKNISIVVGILFNADRTTRKAIVPNLSLTAATEDLLDIAGTIFTEDKTIYLNPNREGLLVPALWINALVKYANYQNPSAVETWKNFTKAVFSEAAYKEYYQWLKQRAGASAEFSSLANKLFELYNQESVLAQSSIGDHVIKARLSHAPHYLDIGIRPLKTCIAAVGGKHAMARAAAFVDPCQAYIVFHDCRSGAPRTIATAKVRLVKFQDSTKPPSVLVETLYPNSQNTNNQALERCFLDACKTLKAQMGTSVHLLFNPNSIREYHFGTQVKKLRLDVPISFPVDLVDGAELIVIKDKIDGISRYSRTLRGLEL